MLQKPLIADIAVELEYCTNWFLKLTVLHIPTVRQFYCD